MRTTTSNKRLDDLHDLNSHINKKYIGVDKPKVTKVKQDFNMPSMFEGTDNMPNDPTEADLEDNGL